MDFLPLLRSVRHPIITGRHVLSEVKSCILDISGSWDKVGQLDGTYWDLAAGSCDGEPSGRCRLIGSRSDAGNLVVVWWWVEMYCVLFGESWRWSAVKRRSRGVQNPVLPAQLSLLIRSLHCKRQWPPRLSVPFEPSNTCLLPLDLLRSFLSDGDVFGKRSWGLRFVQRCQGHPDSAATRRMEQRTAGRFHPIAARYQPCTPEYPIIFDTL